MPGVSLIPLSDGRAFLALERGKGVADLELAVLDRLDGKRGLTPPSARPCSELRQLLQAVAPGRHPLRVALDHRGRRGSRARSRRSRRDRPGHVAMSRGVGRLRGARAISRRLRVSPSPARSRCRLRPAVAGALHSSRRPDPARASLHRPRLAAGARVRPAGRPGARQPRHDRALGRRRTRRVAVLGGRPGRALLAVPARRLRDRWRLPATAPGDAIALACALCC